MIDTGATKITLASLAGTRGDFPPSVRRAAGDLRATMAQILATMPPAPATLRRAIDIVHRGLTSPQ